MALRREARNERAEIADAALLESESQLRQLAESIPILVILCQLDPPAYLYVSPASRTMLGREPDELSADPGMVLQMVHPDDIATLRAGYLVDARAGRLARSEHRILRPDGEVRWVRAVAAPVAHPGGLPQRSVITVEDITEQIRAAEALRDAEATARAANEAKSIFLSRMSHELRTPLNAVLGFGQLLEPPLRGTEHAEALGHILTGGWHLLELINDVLDITRIESGEMAVRVEPVHLGDLVEEAVRLMRPLADSAGITLADPLGPSNCHVLGDRQRLRQILLNLLSNAVKYNRSGGHVWVTWMADAGIATIRVRDDGPGIPPDLQNRVFTPFDRLGAEASGVEGTGIGLALTRSLAELMGGAVVMSSAPGQGSTFVVTLPVTDAPARRSAPASPPRANLLPTPTPPPTDSEQPNRGTVLYVEDNEPNALVFEQVLRLRPEWKLVRAALGLEGIKLAREHRPDLVFLDLHLPDVGGEEVLLALKSGAAPASTPVFILSADATPTHAQQLLDAGADRYLTKPLRVAEILGLLDTQLAARTA